jgi:hypothetical protein
LKRFSEIFSAETYFIKSPPQNASEVRKKTVEIEEEVKKSIGEQSQSEFKTA